MNRKRRVLRAILGLLLLLFGVPGWLTYREVRQQHLDKALIAAIKRDDTHTALALLEQGADPNARDLPNDTRSLWQHLLDTLHHKHPYSDAPTALFLTLRERTDTSFFPGGVVNFIVFQSPEITIFKALVERGADINAKDINGDTLLHQMTLPINYEANEHGLRYLISRGANINARNREGQTPLMVRVSFDLFSRSGVSKITKILSDEGADINAQDTYGVTVLMCAASWENPTYIRFLLDHHANANLQDKYGRTALSFAQMSGEPKLARMLKAAGAKR